LSASFAHAQETPVFSEAAIDTDSDGLTDDEERAVYQTFWYDADTDDDGFSDYEEVENGYSPTQKGMKMNEADTDGDGLNDKWEIKLGTNLMRKDSDDDGYLDGTEVQAGYSPTSTEPVVLDKKIVVSDKGLNLKFYLAGVEVMSIPVSTGKRATPTPKGEFSILTKIPAKLYGGPGFDYNYPNTKWNLHFTTKKFRYFIHGAYWHNNFGVRAVSGGCVNVRYEDMEKLYNFSSVGTKVTII
jgi:lipoprotein-anchoring transpeptidase ErfK/SrfK